MSPTPVDRVISPASTLYLQFEEDEFLLYDWWMNPSLIQLQIDLFRDLRERIGSIFSPEEILRIQVIRLLLQFTAFRCL